MLKAIFKLKIEEVKTIFNSLLIKSEINKLLVKSIGIVLLFLCVFLIICYPVELLYLFNRFNVIFISLDINILFLFTLVTMISGNKNIISTLQYDFYKFYGDRYLFLFFYLKEKIMVFILGIIVLIFVFLSYVFSYISLTSFLISLVSILLFITLNILYLVYIKNKNQMNFMKVLKLFFLLFVFGMFLIFITFNLFGFGRIPLYVVINIPLFYLCANLFIYSELIYANANYRQLFMQFKYLRVPFIKIYGKTILYKNTFHSFIGMNILIILLLINKGFDHIHVLTFIAVNAFAFYLLLLFTYKIVMYESFKGQKNYFFYFFFMELFFGFIAFNIIYIG
ncbi:hypothetical protein CN925_01140 [Bacillus sp. AFS055030]|nr:hypothetical protein CN925_01140 [Bacillus sp. AFS055030]